MLCSANSNMIRISIRYGYLVASPNSSLPFTTLRLQRYFLVFIAYVRWTKVSNLIFLTYKQKLQLFDLRSLCINAHIRANQFSNGNLYDLRSHKEGSSDSSKKLTEEIFINTAVP